MLRISPTPVIAIVKKAAALRHAHPALASPPCSRAVSAQAGRAAEVEEMGSFVGATATARWLWHVLDPHTGSGLAYVLGTRKEAVVLKLKA